MMRLAAVIGDDAVMAGEGQIVELYVRTEDDALSDGIDRSGTVERLGKSRAGAILAANLAIPLTAMVADTDRIATLQLADGGTVAVAGIRLAMPWLSGMLICRLLISMAATCGELSI